MEDLSYSFDRAQISSSSNNRNDLPLSARNCLIGLLGQIQDDDFRQRAQAELRQLLTDHERLMTMLQQRTQAVEDENNRLKAMMSDQQQRYEKAVREMQFFKMKCDKISKQPRRTSISSESPSEVSAHSHSHSQNGNVNISINSSSSSSSSSNNGHRHQPITPNTPLPPVPLPQQQNLPPVPASMAVPVNFPLTPTSPQPFVNSGELSHFLKPSRSSSSSTASSNVQHYQSFWSNNLSNAPPLPSNVSIHSSSSSATASRYQHAPTNSIYSLSTEGSGPYQQYQPSQPPSQQPLSPPPPLQQPLSPPPSTPAYSSIPRHNVSMSSGSGPASYGSSGLVQQRRVDPLMFGGSDSLWDTIAKNKGKDPAVEKIVSDFLRRGGSPNAARQTPSVKDVKFGYGIIHAVVAVKALGTLDLLLQHGANPNAMTLSDAMEDKVSPCYLAARIGWLPGLQRLVQAGADLTQARGEGTRRKTALHVAAEHCHVAVIEFIVGYTEGALNLELDALGATALHYASQTGHADLVSFLIRSCHVPADQTDNNDEQPIHWASRAGRLEVVSLLVERFGVDCNAYVPKRVPTPLELAKSNKHKRVVDYLKTAGGLSAKKMDKKREEEQIKKSSKSSHLQSTLARNGLLGDDGFF